MNEQVNRNTSQKTERIKNRRALFVVVIFCILYIGINLLFLLSEESSRKLKDLVGHQVITQDEIPTLHLICENVSKIANGIDVECYLSSASLEGEVIDSEVELKKGIFVYTRKTSDVGMRGVLHPSFKWRKFIIIEVDLSNNKIIQVITLLSGDQEGDVSLPYCTVPHPKVLPDHLEVKDIEIFLKENIKKTVWKNRRLDVELYLPWKGGINEPRYWVMFKDPIFTNIIRYEITVPVVEIGRKNENEVQESNEE